MLDNSGAKEVSEPPTRRRETFRLAVRPGTYLDNLFYCVMDLRAILAHGPGERPCWTRA